MRSLLRFSTTLLLCLDAGAILDSNFKYSNGHLVFSSYVFSDEDIHTIKKQEEELKARETTALVYDSLYVRHWYVQVVCSTLPIHSTMVLASYRDKYLGPKKSTIFAVKLSHKDGSWLLGSNYFAPLKGTKHVRLCPFP